MDNTFFHKYRNAAIAAVAVLAVLILLFGTEPRQDEKIAAEKEAADLAKKNALPAAVRPLDSAASLKAKLPALPDADRQAAKLPATASLSDKIQTAGAPAANTTDAKDNTDDQRYTTGFDVLNKAVPEIPADSPAKPGEPTFRRYSKEFDPTKIDQINAGLKQAMQMQEQNPGRYQTAPLTPGGNLYGINTAIGGVAVLAKGGEKWQIIGKPQNAAPAENGTYMITHADETTVTIMNTLTTFTWRASLVDGKWQWKEIGGIPDNSWLK